jgi:Trehalose-phosphatase
LHGGMEEGGYVEVRPKGVNKGVLAMRVIKRFPDIAQKEKLDFALVLGDDHCDEPMLSVMRQVGRRVATSRRAQKGQTPLSEMPATIQLVDVSSCDSYLSPDLEVFTCTVGKKPSAAASYLHDVDEVQELLESLVKVSTRDHRYYSAIDLRAYASEQQSPPETMSATSMPKSTSLGVFQKPDTDVVMSSRSLKDYWAQLDTIEDEEDELDDGVYF